MAIDGEGEASWGSSAYLASSRRGLDGGVRGTGETGTVDGSFDMASGRESNERFKGFAHFTQAGQENYE